MNHGGCRRAAILLITLAALVVIMTSAITITGHLMRSRVAAVQMADQRLLADLGIAGEDIARRWLIATSQHVVLAPEGGQVTIACDRIALEGQAVNLQVDCYDLLGMPSIASIRPHGKLSNPMSIVNFSGAEENTWIETVELPLGMRRFPQSIPAPTENWGDVAQSSLSTNAPLELALTGCVGSLRERRININTASAAVLGGVYRELGLGNIGYIFANRRERKLSVAPQFPSEASKVAGDFVLVDRSDLWAALVTTSTTRARRSWWIVFQVATDKVTVVQRHDADR